MTITPIVSVSFVKLNGNEVDVEMIPQSRRENESGSHSNLRPSSGPHPKTKASHKITQQPTETTNFAPRVVL